MVITVFAGELRIYPFGGDQRVSLAVSIFFFILLWEKRINPILTSILVGSSIVIFRILLSYVSNTPTFELDQALLTHFPAFLYYFIFSLVFFFSQKLKLLENHFMIAIVGVISDVSACYVEILFRMMTSEMTVTGGDLLLMIGISIIRVSFVLSIYTILTLRKTKINEEEQKKKNEELLILVSNLFVEMIQLKKTMHDAEVLTSKCFLLHRNLKKAGNEESSISALDISSQMHEIKKDSQRIYSGLSKLLIADNLKDEMTIQEIFQIVTKANQNYSQMIEKNIIFETKIVDKLPKFHTFEVISMINNIVANSVEAIHAEGKILLTAKKRDHFCIITICDNGPGISDKNITKIFNPGFTTKFNKIGEFSSGIGLFHVRNTIESLNGEIKLLESTQDFKTIFELSLPINE